MVSPRAIIKRLFGSESSQALEEEQTQDARIGQLKREFADHPTKGLTPARLYQILEAAEQGDLKAQSELFNDMEEKDSQIGADLGKRRQLAAELEWQIVPPDGASALEKRATEHAIEVFSGLEVEDLILDLGTGIGHGFANLELSWQRDGALRYIEQPTLRPHSWFRLHPDDQNCITLRDHSATGAELWPLGWVEHRHRAKSGYVARMGLHRMLAWPYLFQNYALGDLAQLLEIYGMPARIGKYPKNATEREKATLLRAVVTLGQNAAGIIPQGMDIEFQEAAGKGSSADLYKTMIDWCERAKAKAILGGTLTSGTGEGTNTNALGNVHERGQTSLIRSDVRQYAGSVGKQILWPMAALNYGIEKPSRAPCFYLDCGETEDLARLSKSLPTIVDMGVKVPMWWFHEKSGIPKAAEGEEVLMPKAAPSPFGALRLPASKPPLAALRQAPTQPGQPSYYRDATLDQLDDQAQPIVNAWVNQVQQLVEQAESFEQLQELVTNTFEDLDETELASVMAAAFEAADLAGRAGVDEETGNAD
ncbi:DUF935 domain-containing protein [Vreelandella titanicae]|jgi:phage gp29-like protein|uniref:DUF935 domain-containing protein n=1 Tax=Vreelandella titanicae TaxID=664683 RepID=UPI0015936A6E|nr:DUF935 domain-containing protein [Halomonas titanicae]NVE91553.1 DUF935 domain-containing protein [Halomonas titanicae]|tara:strand:+ start:777 stop:2384 length:1608 start_codon:yes stop_codon:yes gene_type:complete